MAMKKSKKGKVFVMWAVLDLGEPISIWKKWTQAAHVAKSYPGSEVGRIEVRVLE